MAFSTSAGSSAENRLQLLTGSIDLDGSAATALTFTVPVGYAAKLYVKDQFVTLTETVANDNVAATVTYTGGGSLLGTITIPDAAADLGTVSGGTAATDKNGGNMLEAGDTIVVAHTQGTDTSSSAGAGVAHLVFEMWEV